MPNAVEMPAHMHTCTLCEPSREYRCTIRHRPHLQMIGVWRRCPYEDHREAHEYQACSAGQVILAPPTREVA